MSSLLLHGAAQTMQLRRDAEALLAERKGALAKKGGAESRGEGTLRGVEGVALVDGSSSQVAQGSMGCLVGSLCQ